jgi:hypothetical protein
VVVPGVGPRVDAVLDAGDVEAVGSYAPYGPGCVLDGVCVDVEGQAAVSGAVGGDVEGYFGVDLG